MTEQPVRGPSREVQISVTVDPAHIARPHPDVVLTLYTSGTTGVLKAAHYTLTAV